MSKMLRSAPSRATIRPDSSRPASRKHTANPTARPTAWLKITSDSLRSPWYFRMANRIPPPMPIIRPQPWTKLYMGMARLRAVSPLLPSALAMKKVSARM